MVLVKAWVKAELKGILQVGVTSPGVTSRRFRVRQRQHVQCVEVDETWRALKINDGETMVWCFVTKPGMHKVDEEPLLSDKQTPPWLVTKKHQWQACVRHSNSRFVY